MLFVSCAIVLHIAQRHAGLLSEDDIARALAITRLDVRVGEHGETAHARTGEVAKFQGGDMLWAAQRMPLVLDRRRVRLQELSNCLGDAEWLDGDFGASDLMMISMLRACGHRLARRISQLRRVGHPRRDCCLTQTLSRRGGAEISTVLPALPVVPCKPA